MEKIIYNKLVRDGIPEHLDKLGSAYEARVLTDAPEFDQELRKKLVEEAIELREARNREEVSKELGDLLEVAKVLQDHYRITDEEVARLQRERREKKGGFEKKIFLLWSEDDGYEQQKKS